MSDSEEEIVVVATISVKPGMADELIDTFSRVIEATHLEDGCLTYALHRDTGEENRFLLIERWRSQADLNLHFQQPHMAAVAGLADALAGPPEVIFATGIPTGDPAKNLVN